MKIQMLKNGVVYPLLGSMDKFVGGVFDAFGNFLEDSIPARGSIPPLAAPQQRLKGTFLYGGCIFGHFGHFIWESLARLSAIRKCHEYPIIFISPNSQLHKSQRIFLKSIKVNNELLLVKDITQVDNLIYSPPQSSINPLFMSREQLDSLAFTDFSKEACERKIWLSRSRFPTGRILNEDYIENKLAKNGFDIIYPENLPLREQIKIISTSRIVAGFDGSQFFSLLFSRKAKGKYFVFNRRKEVPQTIPYIFEQKKVDYSLNYFPVELHDGDPDSAAANHLSLAPDLIAETLATA